MFQLIKNYVSTLTIDKLNSLALSKGIELDNEELDFLYRFITRNYEALYANPNIDLSKYSHHFKGDNFAKIMQVIEEYKRKYANFLN